MYKKMSIYYLLPGPRLNTTDKYNGMHHCITI